MMNNPKLEGSNIIDCIPQSGECPLKCQECYYNGGRFYRPLTPQIPTLEEVKGKIVRVNSGHDSNLEFEKVITTTRDYPDKYYNTSIPNLRFNAPTMLTINGRDTDQTFIHPSDCQGNRDDLMAIRFRVNTWNIPLCMNAAEYWKPTILLLTDMRYYNRENVKKPEDYEWRKAILNSYFCLKSENLEKILKIFSHYSNVFWCGNSFNHSHYCRDCRLCEIFYAKAKLRRSKK